MSLFYATHESLFSEKAVKFYHYVNSYNYNSDLSLDRCIKTCMFLKVNVKIKIGLECEGFDVFTCFHFSTIQTALGALHLSHV